jgi:replication factor C subunit 3/5
MAYDEINEAAVYASTGNPLPSDLKLMLNLLNNAPMQAAFDQILAIQQQKGLSLLDMLTFLHEQVLQISYPPPVMNFLLSELAALEVRLAQGTNERIQLASLVGVFKQACAMTEQFQIEREKKQQQQLAAGGAK